MVNNPMMRQKYGNFLEGVLLFSDGISSLKQFTFFGERSFSYEYMLQHDATNVNHTQKVFSQSFLFTPGGGSLSHIPIFGCLLNIVFLDDKLRSEDSEEATFTYCTLPLPMAEQDLGSVIHILDLVAL